ncbi:MAG TPA: substrate-binding domain-containing protein, partial [Gemmatimonadaceae bacterium]|nr:substrate-binding domain-containing protein [Gemmatimonadaceae bacterium]
LVPLTTVRVPKYDMGSTAAQMLIQHIESMETVTPRRVYLDATLVVRSSAAPHSPEVHPAASRGNYHPAAVEGS